MKPNKHTSIRRRMIDAARSYMATGDNAQLRSFAGLEKQLGDTKLTYRLVVAFSERRTQLALIKGA